MSNPSDEREVLCSYLQDRDVACPHCSYNLRGLRQDRCPECGTPIEIGVQARRARWRASTTLICVLCAGAGIGLMYLASLTWGYAIGKRAVVFYWGSPDPHWLKIWGPMAIFSAMIPMTAVAFVFRHWFDRRGRLLTWLTITVVAAALITCLYFNAMWWYDRGWHGDW